MGRSSTSCFKIITCGSDSLDHEYQELNESKDTTDKRGWSFRKRSPKHRVLSNTIISENLSSGNKENPESSSINFNVESSPTVPEKISASQTDETPQYLTAVNSSNPLIGSENANKIGPKVEEPVIIVIQASIRGFLARRTLLRLKNVVRLQAAVRGHLVRRQAVGTLRCVQAIVKMQALVRARRARVLVERTAIENKLDGKHGRINQNLKPLGKENSGATTNKTYSSTEKLLRNGFARQLLDSTPKKIPINIKCNPSRPNSAWEWMERWMSVSSIGSAQPNSQQLIPGNREHDNKAENVVSELRTEFPAEVSSESVDLKSGIREIESPGEVEDNMITYDANTFSFQACHPTNTIRDDLEQLPLENVSLSKTQATSSEVGLLLNQIEMQPVSISQKVVDSVSVTPEMNHELSEHTMKKVASEKLEVDGKKLVSGSRKVCNPAFVAAQSKFEELSSVATSSRLSSSTCQDVGVESKLNSLSSPSDSVTKAKKHSLTDTSISHDPRIVVGASECGAELSISSTLDSPNRSEVEGKDFENGEKVVENGACDLNCTDNISHLGNLAVEANSVSSTPLPGSSDLISVQPGQFEYANGDFVDSVIAFDPPYPCPEKSASKEQIQLDNAKDQQAYRLSPEGSPRSLMTAPESHGTPSSEVSVKAKRNKLDKSGPTHNRKSQSAGKSSPSNLNYDSGARSSMEQLPKDAKSGKRRKSFSSERPDYVDQEPRDGGTNSLPSYMQATESARAKALANNSPRSSPDVQDKDISIKKRHSLPSANGKQGSPRIQQSISPAQPGAKGNVTHSLHERKWQR